MGEIDLARDAPTLAAAVAGGGAYVVLLWLVGIMVVLGFVSVLVHRFIMQWKMPSSPMSSMTRPVLAVLLVGAVVILAAASLGGDDDKTRNIMVGGVISLCSAAAAFYFASSGATEARRDVMQAATGSVQVPDVAGKTIDDASSVLNTAGLSLLLWDPKPPSAAVITAQNPPAGTTVSGWTSISVQTKP